MPGKRSCYEYKHRVLREILTKYREATSMYKGEGYAR
nr:MAG TPA: hypothetical protein [Caudoviricetes sp.]